LGIKNSKYKYIFYTDADNQFNVQEIKKFLPYFDDYDIVHGYRKKRKDPIMRKMIAKGYNILLRIRFGLKVKDVDCAFEMYKKEIFDKIKINCITGLTNAEILIKAQRNGEKIKLIPVTHYPRKYGRSVFATASLVKFEVIKHILEEMKKLKQELK